MEKRTHGKGFNKNDEGKMWNVHRLQGYNKHKPAKPISKHKLMFRKIP